MSDNRFIAILNPHESIFQLFRLEGNITGKTLIDVSPVHDNGGDLDEREAIQILAKINKFVTIVSGKKRLKVKDCFKIPGVSSYLITPEQFQALKKIMLYTATCMQQEKEELTEKTLKLEARYKTAIRNIESSMERDILKYFTPTRQ